MDQTTLSRRLEDLEARYAFQEDQLQQLDEVIRDQANRIDELHRILDSIREQVASQGPEEPPPEDQVPPHY